MPTRGQNWQDVQQAALPIIGVAARTDNETIMTAVNAHLDVPLRLFASTPVSRVVNIATIRPTSGDGKKKSIPHIGSIIPAFASGTVTFPSASGGNIAMSTGGTTVLTLGTDLYVNVLIYLDAAGNLGAYVGTPNASAAALLPPPGVRGTFAIGYIQVWNNGGTIQTIAQTDLTQFAGGGGGSGSGNANALLETLKNAALDLPYELLTPCVFDNDESTLVDNTSTGAFSVVTRAFEMDAAETMISKNLLDQGEFIDDGLTVEQIDVMVMWTPTKVDTAATYWVSRNGVAGTYQQITMERIGNGTDTYIGRLIFPASPADTSDLRLKVISPTGSSSLDGFGVFYRSIDAGMMVTGRNNFENQVFDGKTEKLSPCSFTLSRFIPDPDFLVAICDGAVYQYGDFAIDGYKVTFADRFFETPDSGTKLIKFMHVGAGSFDASDRNANLMASNHLGSTDSNADRSLAGRGIMLRRPDGTLREIALDDADNIIVMDT